MSMSTLLNMIFIKSGASGGGAVRDIMYGNDNHFHLRVCEAR